MSINIGAKITGIIERAVQYTTPDEQNPPARTVQTLYIRDVGFEIVGMPPEASPPRFTIAVTDATQWNTLQVGQVCTIRIEPPP